MRRNKPSRSRIPWVAGLVLIPIFSAFSAFAIGRLVLTYPTPGSTEVPQFILVGVAFQVPAILSLWLLPSFTSFGRLRRDDGLILGGAYEIVCGLALVRLFASQELWIGSITTVYVGLAVIVIGGFLRTTSGPASIRK